MSSRLLATLYAALFISGCLSLPGDLGDGPGRTHSSESKDCRAVFGKLEAITVDNSVNDHKFMAQGAWLDLDVQTYRTIQLGQTVCGNWKQAAAPSESIPAPLPKLPNGGDHVRHTEAENIDYAVQTRFVLPFDEPPIAVNAHYSTGSYSSDHYIAGRYSRSSRWGDPQKGMESGREILRNWVDDGVLEHSH